MTKSVTKVQDRETTRRLSVVRSTEDPTKYWVVILNPDGSRIRWPQWEPWEAATIEVGSTTTWNPWSSASVSNSGSSSHAILNFTIPRGDKWETGTIEVGSTATGQPWTNASVENVGTSTSAILNFTIPKGDKWDTGDAATIQVGTTTTLSPGNNASVVNSGTTSDAVLNFSIPRGDKGETWDTGNGIVNTTKIKVGKVTTVEFTYANGSKFDFSVSDGEDGEGAGDVIGPDSSTDGNIVVFDGNTGKLLKDSGKTIWALESAIGNNTTAISTINGKIPNEATANNQLADKDFVNSSINSVTAFYITRNAQGDQFATKAQLDATTVFYSGGEVRVPTRNDYCVVVEDETHDNATTRYIYQNQWEFQYVVNETALTAQQLAALNSWITSNKVSQYDGYATNKQDKLVSGTSIKTINGTSILGSGDIETPNTTYSDATQSVAWLMSASDKTKLDGIEAQAQKNTITGVKGSAESTYRTGQVSISPANLWLESKNAASWGQDVSLVTTGEKYQWNNKADASDINTKTFYLSSTSDLTTAQAAYDWYLAGKNPIVIYNNAAYVVSIASTTLFYLKWETYKQNYADTSTISQRTLNITLSSGTVTRITTGIDGTNAFSAILTGYNYSSPYTPQYDWSPATKKYVDDWLDEKQDELESWVNIKTINWESVLWSWDLEISWGGWGCYADVLVVGWWWWGGAGSCSYPWWWGWAWDFVLREWVPLLGKETQVVAGRGWIRGCFIEGDVSEMAWGNWEDSCFGGIVAIWWWGGWAWLAWSTTEARWWKDWASWWWSGWLCCDTYFGKSIWYVWHRWALAYSTVHAWWWGGAWGEWWWGAIWIFSGSNTWWGGCWITTKFPWEEVSLAWGGAWWRCVTIANPSDCCKYLIGRGYGWGWWWGSGTSGVSGCPGTWSGWGWGWCGCTCGGIGGSWVVYVKYPAYWQYWYNVVNWGVKKLVWDCFVHRFASSCDCCTYSEIFDVEGCVPALWYLVVWWWGGGTSYVGSYNYWWGWGWWGDVYRGVMNLYPWMSFDVVVGAWGEWWCGDWGAWGDSCIEWLISAKWWWGASSRSGWTSWSWLKCGSSCNCNWWWGAGVLEEWWDASTTVSWGSWGWYCGYWGGWVWGTYNCSLGVAKDWWGLWWIGANNWCDATNYWGWGWWAWCHCLLGGNWCQWVVDFCYLPWEFVATWWDECYLCNWLCVHRFLNDWVFCVEGNCRYIQYLIVWWWGWGGSPSNASYWWWGWWWWEIVLGTLGEWLDVWCSLCVVIWQWGVGGTRSWVCYWDNWGNSYLWSYVAHWWMGGYSACGGASWTGLIWWINTSCAWGGWAWIRLGGWKAESTTRGWMWGIGCLGYGWWWGWWAYSAWCYGWCGCDWWGDWAGWNCSWCPATNCGWWWGGAWRNGSGWKGWDWVVDICYKPWLLTATWGDCCYLCNGLCVHRFTTDGTFTVTG